MTAIISGYMGKSHVSLGKQNFSAGALLPFKVPQDVVVKEFIIVANGYIACTFAGTKPTVNPLGVLHGLLDEVYLSRRGTDRVKSFRGTRHMRNTVERKFGQNDPTIYKVNATNLAGAVVQGLPVWGTTTQNTAFREGCTMMMENKLSGAWYPTLFSTKNLQTATLNIKCGQFSGVQDPEDSNVGTYAGSIEIEVFASCSDFMLGQTEGVDFNQNIEELEFSGAQTNRRGYINPVGVLQGMWITGNHEGSKPFDFNVMKNTRLEVKYQGIVLAEGSLADFMEIDLVKTNLSSRLKGSAYLSFVNNGDPRSGLPIAEGKQIELSITTDPALSYTIPVKLIFEYDQLLDASAQAAASKAA